MLPVYEEMGQGVQVGDAAAHAAPPAASSALPSAPPLDI